MFYTGDMAMTPPPQSTYVIRFASKCVRRLYQTIECIDQRLLLRAQCTIHGVPTGCYHAGLGAAQRRAVQQAWQRGEPAVVCATIAMGASAAPASPPTRRRPPRLPCADRHGHR